MSVFSLTMAVAIERSADKPRFIASKRKDLRQEFPDGKIPDEARKQKEKKLVDSFQDRVKELKEGGGKPVTTVERQKAILEGMDSVLCPMAETVENCQRDARRLEGEIRVLEAILEHSPSEQLEKLLLSKRAEVDGLKSVLHRIAETLEGCKRVAMAAKETIELEEQRDDAADEQVTRGRGRPRKTITPTPDAETDNPAQFSVAQKTPFAGMQRFGEAGLLRHLGDNLRDGIGALGIGGVAAGAVEAGRRLLWGTGGVGLPGAGG